MEPEPVTMIILMVILWVGVGVGVRVLLRASSWCVRGTLSGAELNSEAAPPSSSRDSVGQFTFS